MTTRGSLPWLVWMNLYVCSQRGYSGHILYGKPLGNKHDNDLTGFLKIKLRGAGLHVVYKVIKTETEMLIVVIGARADDEVYQIAGKRIRKYDV